MSDGRNDSKITTYSKPLLQFYADLEGLNKTGRDPIGKKFDGDKPRISLIPAEAIEEMAKAFTYGANKYGAHNFKNGIAYSRLIDAALRHILAITKSEFIDSESSNSHVGHAMASLAMLAYMMAHKPENNDVYKEIK